MDEKRIAGVGFTFGDSMSNFIFASHERVPATELFEALRREHIYVRHFTKERINNYLAHQHRNERRDGDVYSVPEGISERGIADARPAV